MPPSPGLLDQEEEVVAAVRQGDLEVEEQEERWMRRPRKTRTSSTLSERDRSLCW